MTAGQVVVYTDGSRNDTANMGGCGFVFDRDGAVYEGAWHAYATSSSRAELLAATGAVMYLATGRVPYGELPGGAVSSSPKIVKGWDRPASVAVYTDSMYLVDGFTKWVHGWVKYGWKTKSGSPVKHQDLWVVLHAARMLFDDLEFTHVAGHSGVLGNERADVLARYGSRCASVYGSVPPRVWDHKGPLGLVALGNGHCINMGVGGIHGVELSKDEMGGPPYTNITGGA